MDGMGSIVFVAFVLVVMFFIFVMALASRYRKAGPNEALIISGGRKGFRVVTGGGVFVWPIIEKVDVLSLEIMTLDIKTPEVYTITGVPIVVDGVAQIKVGGREEMMRTAAQQFLSKSRTEMQEVALQTLEGHLRAIIGTLTVEEIYKDRERFAQEVQKMAATDLANMGLEIRSFTLRNITDQHGYLDALGKPRTAQVRRDAQVGEAEATRDAAIRSAAAKQAAREAEFAAETKIAESQRDYEMKKANYVASVNQQKAQSDLAYDLQKYKTSQSVKAEEVQVQVIEKERQIDVQEKEIQRKQKELDATVNRPADAERYRIQTLAEAEKYKLYTEASGQADATKSLGIGAAEAERAKGFAAADVRKATGLAEADAERAKGLAAADVRKAQGLAEAEVVLAKGKSEAEAMARKAEAWRQYSEAAIVQMLIERLPEITRAVAEPLSKTDRIVVVSTGGDSAGVSKITKDITNIVAQVPPLIEALSGVDLKELVARVPGLARRPDEGKEGKEPPEPPKKGTKT